MPPVTTYNSTLVHISPPLSKKLILTSGTRCGKKIDTFTVSTKSSFNGIAQSQNQLMLRILVGNIPSVFVVLPPSQKAAPNAGHLHLNTFLSPTNDKGITTSYIQILHVATDKKNNNIKFTSCM